MEVLVGAKRKRVLAISTFRLKRELSEEVVIEEILMRLPIKSVVRFKSVSKSRLSLLSNSHFIQKHCSMQNPNDCDCLVANKYTHITTFTRNQETFALPNNYYLIGSVNGLVCLLRGFRRLSLWNPAIHQSMEFNLPQGGYGNCPTLVGVGFDSVSNDYKVVVCYPFNNSCTAAVYSSNSNLWIPLSVPDHELLMNKFKDLSFIPTTYVKNCPYWTYSTYLFDKKKLVTFSNFSPNYGTYPSDKSNYVKSLTALKFDATSNEFKLLPEFFPDAPSRERGKIFKFVNMQDLFTLLAYEASPTGKLDVYSLDNEKGCGVWIKMHQVGPFERFRLFHILQQGFKYSDGIVFFEFGKIYFYDHKRDKFECLPGILAYKLLNCFTYTPNMVSLRGMKSIYLDNQTRPLGHPMQLITSLKE